MRQTAGPDDANPSSTPPSGSGAGRLRRRLLGWLGEPGTERRVLARNALWNWGSFVLQALVVAFLSPYMVRKLGDGAYGYWEAVLELIAYLAIADLGVRPAIVHFVARHDALKDADRVNGYVNTAFVTLAIGGGIVFLGACIAAPFAPDWFSVGAEHATETTWATVIAGATLAFSLPWNAYSAVLIGKQRFDISCRIDVFILLLRAVLVIGALVLGFGLIGVAVAAMLSSWTEMAWKSLAAFRIEPTLRFKPRLIKWSRAKELLAYGGFGLVVMFATRLVYRTDSLVIGLVEGAAWVALFAFGAKLAHYTREMLYSVGRVLTPAMGAIEARDESTGPARYARLSGLLTAAGRNMLMLAGPLIVYWCVMGGAFLETWVGQGKFREHGHVPLVILAIGALAPIASYPIVAAHYGTNRMRSLAVFSGLEGVLNLGLSIILVFPYGLAGVALGTAIPGFLVNAFLMPAWMSRQLHMSMARYLVQVWMAPLAGGAAATGVMLALFDPSAQYGWGTLIYSGLLCAAVFYAVGFGLQRLLSTARSDDKVYRGPTATETISE